MAEFHRLYGKTTEMASPACKGSVFTGQMTSYRPMNSECQSNEEKQMLIIKLPVFCFSAEVCVGEGPWMVIIAMDAAEVARTADSKDGVDVICCRDDADTVCDTADVSAITVVVSDTNPFEVTAVLSSASKDFESHVLESTTSGRQLVVDCSCIVAESSETTQLPAFDLFLNTGTGGLVGFCVPSGKLLFLKLDWTASGKLVSLSGNASVVELSFVSDVNVRLSQTANSEHTRYST